MATPKMTAEQKKWRAEVDASSLANAAEILSDPARMKAAQSAAAKRAKDVQKSADALSSVAKGQMQSKNGSKPNGAGKSGSKTMTKPKAPGRRGKR